MGEMHDKRKKGEIKRKNWERKRKKEKEKEKIRVKG